MKDITTLTDRELALRAKALQDQMDGAVDKDNTEHFKQTALGLCDCMAEYYRRQKKPIPDSLLEFREQVEAGVYAGITF